MNKCSYCDKSYTRSFTLKCHIKKKHAAKTESLDTKLSDDLPLKQMTKLKSQKRKAGDRSVKIIASSRLRRTLPTLTPKIGKLQKKNTKKSGNSQLIQRKFSEKGKFIIN